MAQPQAQPNRQRLADAASEECSRLPNIPAINTSQTLVDLISQLRDEMGQVRGEVDQLRDEMGQLRDEMGQLRDEMGQLRDEMGQLRGEVGQLRGEMGQLRGEMRQLAPRTTERFDSLQADIGVIHTRLDVSEGNAIARLFNSTINNPQTPFQPLRNRHNMPVQSFPENGEALSNLGSVELTTILREYNLSDDGSPVDKKKRLAYYIGVVRQVL